MKLRQAWFVQNMSPLFLFLPHPAVMDLEYELPDIDALYIRSHHLHNVPDVLPLWKREVQILYRMCVQGVDDDDWPGCLLDFDKPSHLQKEKKQESRRFKTNRFGKRRLTELEFIDVCRELLLLSNVGEPLDIEAAKETYTVMSALFTIIQEADRLDQQDTMT